MTHAPSLDAPRHMQPPNTPYYSAGLRARYILAEYKAKISPDSPTYAKVGYEYDSEAHSRRTEARMRPGGLARDIPDGWPKSLSGPMVWSSSDFKDESSFIYMLTNDDKSEIHKALDYFLGQGLYGSEVCAESFPLPSLSKQLRRIQDDIYDGRGFAIIRGLDVNKYSNEDLVVIYLGLTSHIGEKRGKQDQDGSMLKHVTNADEQHRSRSKNIGQPFHTDTVCDCLCLFTKSCAAIGGRSLLASASAVYNELASDRPDLIHTLARGDWPFDTFGRQPPYFTRPLLFCHDSKIIMNFSRRMLCGSPDGSRSPGIPGLTEAQAEAIDTVHAIASKHQIKTTMRQGDIRIVNNMGILHSRETFEDNNLTYRHLIRLWLHNATRCWKLPETLGLAWTRVFDDPDRDERWDIEPVRAGGRILKVAMSCD